MSSLQTGLRHRLRRVVRQVATQHRHLQTIREELDRACQQRIAPVARVACARYREALTAHFALEQQMFFPALHGLHPERSEELEALDREHGAMLAQLDELLGLFERGDLPAAETLLGRLTDRLDAHEATEETLVRLLSR